MAQRRVASHHTLFSRVILTALTLVALLATAAAQPLWAQPVVTTDQREYLLGATVHILGSGFAGNETVTVKVHRTSTFFESGPAFVPFVVEADATGHFSTPWQLVDGIGVNFRVSAVGAISGAAVEPADFHRGALVTTDRRRYAPGDTAHISGSGFRPGAPVTVSMEHAQPTAPGPATADALGRFNATFVVDANPSAPSHRVRAWGAVDAHSVINAMAGFAEGGTTLVDDGGPEDVPRGSYWSHWRENDLLYYRFSFRKDISPRVLDVTVGWNASWISPSYNLPTIFLDTNHNGRIDLAVTGEVEGDPIDDSRSTFPYVCDDTSAITCVGWADAPGNGGRSWYKPTAGTVVQNVVLPLTEIGLPADAAEPTIVNVCNGTEDCIVTPGNGFLTIEQVVPAGNGTGAFTFNLASGMAQNGATSWSITPALVNGGAFGTVQFISMPPGTYTLNDVVPAGWQLTTAGCRTDGQSTFAEGLPVAGPSTVSVEHVVINPGQVTRCKFGASRLAPTSTAR